MHVLVKFSGSDEAPGTRRWSDLLVCEHLASEVVRTALRIETARSVIHQAAGRTFLEVIRFDRHGLRGRSALCSWAALNNALFGMAGRPWSDAADRLFERGWLDAATREAMLRIWYFGQLIGNTDMHDGNLSFLPGTSTLQLAPIYDMLPMMYAPQRGVELPVRTFIPSLPMPGHSGAWREAARAAAEFWHRASVDPRISMAFRRICADNAPALRGAPV